MPRIILAFLYLSWWFPLWLYSRCCARPAPHVYGFRRRVLFALVSTPVGKPCLRWGPDVREILGSSNLGGTNAQIGAAATTIAPTTCFCTCASLCLFDVALRVGAQPTGNSSTGHHPLQSIVGVTPPVIFGNPKVFAGSWFAVGQLKKPMVTRPASAAQHVRTPLRPNVPSKLVLPATLRSGMSLAL